MFSIYEIWLAAFLHHFSFVWCCCIPWQNPCTPSSSTILTSMKLLCIVSESYHWMISWLHTSSSALASVLVLSHHIRHHFTHWILAVYSWVSKTRSGFCPQAGLAIRLQSESKPDQNRIKVAMWTCQPRWIRDYKAVMRMGGYSSLFRGWDSLYTHCLGDYLITVLAGSFSSAPLSVRKVEPHSYPPLLSFWCKQAVWVSQGSIVM